MSHVSPIFRPTRALIAMNVMQYANSFLMLVSDMHHANVWYSCVGQQEGQLDEHDLDLDSCSWVPSVDCVSELPGEQYQESSAVHVQDIMNHIPTLNNVMFFFFLKNVKFQRMMTRWRAPWV